MDLLDFFFFFGVKDKFMGLIIAFLQLTASENPHLNIDLMGK